MGETYSKSEQVPASEEIDDLGSGIIRMQLPTAIPLMLLNLVLMYWLVFR